MSAAASQPWLSAAELAELRLPGLPHGERAINALANAQDWRGRTDVDGQSLCRKRGGRGGGYEYHVDVLPAAARRKLAKSVEATVARPDSAPVETSYSERWARFERQNATARGRAEKRLSILKGVLTSEALGMTRSAAVRRAAIMGGISDMSIWRWFSDLKDVPSDHWLPYLAFHSGKGREETEIDAESWRLLKSDYLRPEKPSWSECYRRIADDYAAPRGIALPNAGTLLRRLRREVPRDVESAARNGIDTARLTLPSQQRSVADLHALYAVNIDGHTVDVFVNWGKDAKGKDIIARPVLLGIQDIYSRKVLAHRIGESESTALTRMAFADLFRDFGIPYKCVMDNGRAFASKALTGGAKTRFRFKIKDSDPTGLLTSLDIDPKWTLPYRGSSKPIERAWKDFCELIAKHPECAGAYTGNKPDAKPDNYGSRAIPIEQFRALVARQIARHNARLGRRTEMAQGRSFDEVFAESYAVSPIRKASEMDMRKAFLEAEERQCNRRTGEITLDGNRYHSSILAAYRGHKVRVRFDPDNLHSAIHVYAHDDAYIGEVPVIAADGFFDKTSAERRRKLEADHRRKVRAAVDSHRQVTADKIAELLSENVQPAPCPSPSVVRPVRHRRSAAALKPQSSAAEMQRQEDFMAAFGDSVEKGHRLRLVK